MSCCMKRVETKEKRLKKNTISPQTNKYIEDIEYEIKNIEQDIDTSIEGHITCYHCKEIFDLKGTNIKINCGNCNEFFHCHIAGTCRGEDCTGIVNGRPHTLSYCLMCVNPITCRGTTCLCNQCIEGTLK